LIDIEGVLNYLEVIKQYKNDRPGRRVTSG